MGWTWYIDNDMVFFIFMPWLIILYKKNRKVFYAIMTAVVLMNVGYTFAITFIKELPGFMTIKRAEYDKYIYRRPWGRCGAYVIGVTVGCLYYEYRNQDKDE